MLPDCIAGDWQVRDSLCSAVAFNNRDVAKGWRRREVALPVGSTRRWPRWQTAARERRMTAQGGGPGGRVDGGAGPSRTAELVR